MPDNFSYKSFFREFVVFSPQDYFEDLSATFNKTFWQQNIQEKVHNPVKVIIS
jgi:hypothetical protein